MSIDAGKGHVQEPTQVSLTGTVVDSRYLEGDSSPLDAQNIPAVIPPDHEGRTLVLCFDGTGDQFDADNSNIVQLVALLKKDDRTKQLVYYQAGIGTYTSPKVATPFASSIRKTLDEMFAWNLHAHVMSGYEFLMQHCIMRTNQTTSSLAGMLHKVGLLPADNFQQVPFAYKMYTRADAIGWEQSTEFKKTFAVDVPIEFIGVWDTVDSVGIIPKSLPFTTSNTIVRTFRHAVSLDEHRAKFKANLWNRPNAEELKLGTDTAATNPAAPTDRATSFDDPRPRPNPSHKASNGKYAKYTPNLKLSRSGSIPKEDQDDRVLNTYERLYSEKSERTTDIEEVWFAGCHCDVGGGSVSNKTRHSLARITLRWIVRECFKTKTGILFNSAALRDIGLDPCTLYPTVTPRPPPLSAASHAIRIPPARPIPIRPHAFLKKKKQPHPEVQVLLEAARMPFLGSEEEEELHDALSPKYDQLKLKKLWWVLEILPLRLRYQRGDNQWVSYFGSNMGQARFIPKQKSNGLKVHRSVKMRMEAEYEDEAKRRRDKRYHPKPEFKVEPTWID
ncbi:hypothetical protein BJ912DRAFT_990493 [Pholiota molesta]|nr:hypothetical protein BJ912DRAFT_990493 [Pholiota molesta]